MLNKLYSADDVSSESRSGPWIAVARVFAGLLLLFEVVAGGWWKLGTLGSGPNEEWLGTDAGAAIVSTAERAVEAGTYGWYATIVESVLIPYATMWSYVATVAQLAVAIALIVGLWTRPAALIGLLYFVPVFHFGTIRTSPLFAVPIAFAFAVDAGRYYGLDGVLADRNDAIGRATRLVSLPGLVPTSWYPTLAAGLTVVATYYYLSVPTMESTRIALVGLEVAVLAGLLAFGLTLVSRGADRLAVAADMLRIFVGYRFLHEIFVRTEPGVNALPGWAGVDAQREVFEAIAAAHVAPVTALIETAILPVLGVWVVIFALVQTATGVALLVGWRTRLAGTAAVGYLLVLIALGFVRLAPLLLASAIVAATLAGRTVSLDAVAGRSPSPASVPSPGSRGTAVAALVLVGLGTVLGVEPGGYGETTGPIALVFLGFVAAAYAIGSRSATSTDDRPTGAVHSSDD